MFLVHFVLLSVLWRASSQCSYGHPAAEAGKVVPEYDLEEYKKGTWTVYCPIGRILNAKDPTMLYSRFSCVFNQGDWYGMSCCGNCTDKAMAKYYGESVDLMCETDDPNLKCNYNVISSNGGSTPVSATKGNATCKGAGKKLFISYKMDKQGLNTTVSWPAPVTSVQCTDARWQSETEEAYIVADQIECRTCGFAAASPWCPNAAPSPTAEPPTRDSSACKYTCPAGKKMFGADGKKIDGDIISAYFGGFDAWMPFITGSFNVDPLFSTSFYCDFDSKCVVPTPTASGSPLKIIDSKTASCDAGKTMHEGIPFPDGNWWKPADSDTATCAEENQETWKVEGSPHTLLECRTCTMPSQAPLDPAFPGAVLPIANRCQLTCGEGQNLYRIQPNGGVDKKQSGLVWWMSVSDSSYKFVEKVTELKDGQMVATLYVQPEGSRYFCSAAAPCDASPSSRGSAVVQSVNGAVCPQGLSMFGSFPAMNKTHEPYFVSLSAPGASCNADSLKWSNAMNPYKHAHIECRTCTLPQINQARVDTLGVAGAVAPLAARLTSDCAYHCAEGKTMYGNFGGTYEPVRSNYIVWIHTPTWDDRYRYFDWNYGGDQPLYNMYDEPAIFYCL